MPRISRSPVSPSSPSSSFPRYTTYTPEELRSTLARYSHTGTREGVDTDAPASQSGGSGRSKLIKSHGCCVSYPDGTIGTCRYTRGGPTWHVFRFEHESCSSLQQQLPVRNCTERMKNTTAAIEAKAAEFATAAFAHAIEREWDERFKRASVPMGYNRYTPFSSGNRSSLTHLSRPQMSTKRAKDLAGKYALCLRLGNGDSQRFIPCMSFVFDSLDEANMAWRANEHRSRRFVACLCRYNRQWELPLYSPLYGDREYAILLGLPDGDDTEPVSGSAPIETQSD